MITFFYVFLWFPPIFFLAITFFYVFYGWFFSTPIRLFLPPIYCRSEFSYMYVGVDSQYFSVFEKPSDVCVVDLDTSTITL